MAAARSSDFVSASSMTGMSTRVSESPRLPRLPRNLCAVLILLMLATICGKKVVETTLTDSELASLKEAAEAVRTKQADVQTL